MNRNRTRTGRPAVFLTRVLSLMAFMLQPSLAATDDAVSDFSIASNPNGSWSYGWEANLGGAFTLYAVTGTPNGPGIDMWLGPDSCGVAERFPLVGFNNTGAIINYAGGVSLPANMLTLHPSCTGKFSVARWTAPTTGWFSVVGLFQGIDTRGTTTDVHILQDSATTLLGANINGFGDQAPFSFARYLAAGETLDFVVGFGFNGTFWDDSTGLAVTITTRYNVCLLYDPTKAVKSGATYPIKLQLCDSSGNNLSSSNITVHAVSLTQTSSSISGPVESPGNANPDNDFRFDATLGPTGGYILNLKTTGLATGSYTLNFSVTGDSNVYAAPFQVK